MMLEIAIDSDGEWDSSHSWEDLARDAAAAAISESAFPQLAASRRAVELSIRLSSDENVRALNAEWRGKDHPTNVLSFPLADSQTLGASAGEGPEILLGDIVLARETCAAEARDKGIGFADHAAHLLVHGTLHLLGYDHLDEASAEDMERREVRALTRLGIANPYEAAT